MIKKISISLCILCFFISSFEANSTIDTTIPTEPPTEELDPSPDPNLSPYLPARFQEALEKMYEEISKRSNKSQAAAIKSDFEKLTNQIKDYSKKYSNLFPSQEIIDDPDCKLALRLYTSALSSKKREKWALIMSDASGGLAPPQGMYSGNKVSLGQFDQCIRIHKVVKNVNNGKKVEINGRYCLAKIGLSKEMVNGMFEDTKDTNIEQQTRIMTMREAAAAFVQPGRDRLNRDIIEELKESFVVARYASCLPAICKPEYIEKFMKQNLQLAMPTSIQGADNASVKVNQLDCQDKSTLPYLHGWDWAVFTVFLVFGLLILGQTLYDAVLYYKDMSPTHGLLVSFSVIRNGAKLLEVSTRPDQFHCLHGIRWLSMMWVILGHQIMFCVMNQAAFNSVDINPRWLEHWYNFIPLGGMAAVDSFLLISGMLGMYIFLKSKAAGRLKAAGINIPLMYLHRYVRLTPAIIFLLLFILRLSKFACSGPFQPETIELERKGCEKSWWAMLLYIQNYRSPTNICLLHSWYLSTDMQCFIISPIFMYSAWKFPKYAIIGFLVLIAIFTFIPFLILFLYDVKVSYLSLKLDSNYFTLYYYPTHTRIAAYFIGQLLGFIMFEKKKSLININFKLNLLFWFISIVVMLCILICQFPMNQPNYKRITAVEALYESVHRPLWCIGLAWIIFSCSFGYGGSINWFLSAPIFQILAKLTYCMYLIHLSILNYRQIGNIKVPYYWSSGNLFYEFWSHLVVVTFFGAIWTLAFEMPFGNLESMIFKRPVLSSDLTTRRSKYDFDKIKANEGAEKAAT